MLVGGLIRTACPCVGWWCHLYCLSVYWLVVSFILLVRVLVGGVIHTACTFVGWWCYSYCLSVCCLVVSVILLVRLLVVGTILLACPFVGCWYNSSGLSVGWLLALLFPRSAIVGNFEIMYETKMEGGITASCYYG